MKDVSADTNLRSLLTVFFPLVCLSASEPEIDTAMMSVTSPKATLEFNWMYIAVRTEKYSRLELECGKMHNAVYVMV